MSARVPPGRRRPGRGKHRPDRVRHRGYGAGAAVSATRTATPQIDVPVAVSVAPRETITDIAATRVDRVFDYLPGVARQNNFGGLSIFSYAIRGVTTSEIYKNGFPLNRGTPPPPDAQNIERIEGAQGAGSGPVRAQRTPAGWST